MYSGFALTCNRLGAVEKARKESEFEIAREVNQDQKDETEAQRNNIRHHGDRKHWSWCGVGDEGFPISRDTMLNYLRLGHGSEVMPGLQQLAAGITQTRGLDMDSLFRPVIRTCDVPVGIDAIALSRLRKKNRTCFEIHSGMCRNRDAGSITKAKRFHRRLVTFITGLGKAKHACGEATFYIATNPTPISAETIRSLGTCRVFTWTTFHATKRKGLLSEWTFMQTVADEPMQIQLRVGDEMVVQHYTWEVALSVIRADAHHVAVALLKPRPYLGPCSEWLGLVRLRIYLASRLW